MIEVKEGNGGEARERERGKNGEMGKRKIEGEITVLLKERRGKIRDPKERQGRAEKRRRQREALGNLSWLREGNDQQFPGALPLAN